MKDGRNIKGYTLTKNGTYKARITVDNKKIYLGYYDTEEEARKAYIDAKLKYHNINLV